MRINPERFAAAFAVLALGTAAPAFPQAKKLYCWDEKGTRVCGDALPASAVNGAREEFSAKTGQRTAEVARALTPEEEAAAAADAQRKAAQAAADETRRRTEQAMLTSYASEDDLRRVFNERVGLIDNNIKTARFNASSMRDALVTALQGAAERELNGKPVPAQMAADIRRRHAELQQQLRLQAEFERNRVELDAEIAQILQRYREIKGIATPAAAASSAAPARR
jgi:hypothetical protein